jgi:hypothetical protein
MSEATVADERSIAFMPQSARRRQNQLTDAQLRPHPTDVPAEAEPSADVSGALRGLIG